MTKEKLGSDFHIPRKIDWKVQKEQHGRANLNVTKILRSNANVMF